jgi:four helix bundle protein
MMENIRSLQELRCCSKGMDLAREIFNLTKQFPSNGRYSLAGQIRRSSRSVPANISEAWRKRRCPAAFVSKLNDAEGEAAETQTHLEISRRCGYADRGVIDRLEAAHREVLGMLVNMAAHPEQWSIR